MCSLRFENNLLTIEGVRFASISKKTPLSKLFVRFRFASVAITSTLFVVGSILKGDMLFSSNCIKRYCFPSFAAKRKCRNEPKQRRNFVKKGKERKRTKKFEAKRKWLAKIGIWRMSMWQLCEIDFFKVVCKAGHPIYKAPMGILQYKFITVMYNKHGMGTFLETVYTTVNDQNFPSVLLIVNSF
jgi:hypothetical protein